MYENFKKFTMLEDQPTTASDSTGNTDGEDIQRIEDLDRKMWAIVQATPTFSSNPEDYLKPWRELINQKLASLREQLATEQDMRSTAEFANRMIIKDLNEKLKQKEDENRELVQSIKEMVPILESALTSAKYGYDSKEYCAELELLIKKANNLSA